MSIRFEVKNAVIVDWVKNKKFTMTELCGAILVDWVLDVVKSNNVKVCKWGCLAG